MVDEAGRRPIGGQGIDGGSTGGRTLVYLMRQQRVDSRQEESLEHYRSARAKLPEFACAKLSAPKLLMSRLERDG